MVVLLLRLKAIFRMASVRGACVESLTPYCQGEAQVCVSAVRGHNPVKKSLPELSLDRNENTLAVQCKFLHFCTLLPFLRHS